MKRCPFCAEEVQEEAVKCPYCRSWIGSRDQGPDFEGLHQGPGALPKKRRGAGYKVLVTFLALVALWISSQIMIGAYEASFEEEFFRGPDPAARAALILMGIVFLGAPVGLWIWLIKR